MALQIIKMFNSFKRAALLSIILLGVGNVKAQKDPCTMIEPLSGGMTLTSNGNEDVGNGYYAEIWKYNTSSQGKMTVFGGEADCAFKASWDECGDFLAQVGYYDGKTTKTYKELGRISAEYCYTKSGSANSSYSPYSYIGVYGWTKDPLIEYYIVDDCFAGAPAYIYGGIKIGDYPLDGETYDLYQVKRYMVPTIIGTANCTGLYAIRRATRQCGHVSVSEHFKKWEELGIKLGKIYACRLLCEVSGGKGSIEYTYATMRWKGQTGHGIVFGDVNNDNAITMADANAVVNYFLAADKPADFKVDAADVNCDGDVTMADANQIVNMFLGGAQ